LREEYQRYRLLVTKSEGQSKQNTNKTERAKLLTTISFMAKVSKELYNILRQY